MKPADNKFTPAPLFVIAGPCVIESEALCMEVAEYMHNVCKRVGFQYIFKASFDKANRSSKSSFRGPGLEKGLAILKSIKDRFSIPVLTDVHESHQAEAIGAVVDILQIPAFLARQTDLLEAAGKTGKWVNIKKGQFMSPQEMGNAIDKVKATGNSNIMLTERGTFFGYGSLVNDFTGLAVMKEFRTPVIFDATHSTQRPAGLGNASGGNPQYAPLLARAAVAAGVDGLFLECHPDPKNAKSDAATMLTLKQAEQLLTECKLMREAFLKTLATV